MNNDMPSKPFYAEHIPVYPPIPTFKKCQAYVWPRLFAGKQLLWEFDLLHGRPRGCSTNLHAPGLVAISQGPSNIPLHIKSYCIVMPRFFLRNLKYTQPPAPHAQPRNFS